MQKVGRTVAIFEEKQMQTAQCNYKRGKGHLASCSTLQQHMQEMKLIYILHQDVQDYCCKTSVTKSSAQGTARV